MNSRITWIVTLLLIAFSCQKEEYSYPLIFTGDVTDVNVGKAVFNGKFVSTGNLDIVEYGFVWDSIPMPSIEKSPKAVCVDPTKEGAYTVNVEAYMRKNVAYYVRAYARNEKFTTYGKEVRFKSQGNLTPIIKDFYPKNANLFDTITIVGKNFSGKLSDNIVTVGGVETSIAKANNDTLAFIVPDGLTAKSSTIVVTIQGQKAESEQPLAIIVPAISSITPKIGTYLSTLTINGENFKQNESSLKILIDLYEARILEVTDKSLKVEIPAALDKRLNTVSVTMNHQKVTAAEKFELLPATIDDFTPHQAKTEEAITLKGANFSPITGNNKVTIDGFPAAVRRATATELEVVISSQEKVTYSSRDVKVEVEILGEKKTFSSNLTITDSWFKKTTYPGFLSNIYNSLFYINVNGNIYMGMEQSNEFWRYSPKDNSWQKLESFPGSIRGGATGFYLNGKIYVGLGASGFNTNYNDFWSYDIISNTWIQLNNFPGAGRTGASGFAINNSGFITGGEQYASIGGYNHPYIDTWEYNPAEDKWAKRKTYSEYGEGQDANVDGLSSASVVVYNGTAYWGLGGNYTQGDYDQRLFALTPSESYTWKRVANYPLERDYDMSSGILLNGKIYFKSYSVGFPSNNIYQYDPVQDQWIKDDLGIKPYIKGDVFFESNGKVYIGIGPSKEIWEYDPTK